MCCTYENVQFLKMTAFKVLNFQFGVYNAYKVNKNVFFTVNVV